MRTVPRIEIVTESGDLFLHLGGENWNACYSIFPSIDGIPVARAQAMALLNQFNASSEAMINYLHSLPEPDASSAFEPTSDDIRTMSNEVIHESF
jgi:hypothetical protein